MPNNTTILNLLEEIEGKIKKARWGFKDEHLIIFTDMSPLQIVRLMKLLS